jgi:hypothetical protein
MTASKPQKERVMKRFLVLYNGPPAPPDATHEGWREWFDNLGDALVDLGSQMTNGVVVHRDGSTSDETSSLSGYCIIEADDRANTLELVRDHPLLTLVSGYTIEVFEVPGVSAKS